MSIWSLQYYRKLLMKVCRYESIKQLLVEWAIKEKHNNNNIVFICGFSRLSSIPLLHQNASTWTLIILNAGWGREDDQFWKIHIITKFNSKKILSTSLRTIELAFEIFMLWKQYSSFGIDAFLKFLGSCPTFSAALLCHLELLPHE